jgi:hypothetical protein
MTQTPSPRSRSTPLSPDFFRAAAENFYKARKEYRLKNFDNAKRFAIRSIRYSERAEFEAYLKGGAAPETALLQKPKEGASGDPEESMKHARDLQKNYEDEQYKVDKENKNLKTSSEFNDEPKEEVEVEAEPVKKSGEVKPKKETGTTEKPEEPENEEEKQK